MKTRPFTLDECFACYDGISAKKQEMFKMFKELSEQEQSEFKLWARKHYKPFSEISGVWHPVIQTECTKMNIAAQAEIDYVVKGVI
jgi:hypothetical protein